MRMFFCSLKCFLMMFLKKSPIYENRGFMIIVRCGIFEKNS